MKKGILSCDIELKPKFPGNDTVVIQAVKQKAYDINSLITSGIREAIAYMGGSRFPQ